MVKLSRDEDLETRVNIRQCLCPKDIEAAEEAAAAAAALDAAAEDSSKEKPKAQKSKEIMKEIFKTQIDKIFEVYLKIFKTETDECKEAPILQADMKEMVNVLFEEILESTRTCLTKSLEDAREEINMMKLRGELTDSDLLKAIESHQTEYALLAEKSLDLTETIHLTKASIEMENLRAIMALFRHYGILTIDKYKYPEREPVDRKKDQDRMEGSTLLPLEPEVVK